MSDAQIIDLKPQDRMAQAGIILTEQAGMALLSDAYKFPENPNGTMQTVAADGTLKIDGPVSEYVKTTMMFKKDDSTTQFGTWNHTEAVDPNGNPLSTVDQTNTGLLLDVLITNKMSSHSDFKGPDGNVQFQLDDGFTLLTPHDGSVGNLGGTQLPDGGKAYAADTTIKVKDAAGNYMADVHVMAKPKGQGNILDITASYSSKGTYLGDIEMILTVDPKTHQTATFQIQKVFNPPPAPPTPAPKA